MAGGEGSGEGWDAESGGEEGPSWSNSLKYCGKTSCQSREMISSGSVKPSGTGRTEVAFHRWPSLCPQTFLRALATTEM